MRSHTRAQCVLLVVNVMVVLVCFAAAVALLIGKRARESFVAAPHVSFDPAPRLATSTAPTSSMPVTTGASAAIGEPPVTFPAVDPHAENFLITGDDNNPCVDPNSPWAGAVQGRENIGSRSDTIMVLRLDPVSKAAAILSFPRDLWVKIPGRGMQRINTTFQRGQYDLMAQTIDQNFGVRVDHFVQIDFCAFKSIVDAVGGVAIPLARPIRDANTGIDIEDVSVCHTFSGDEALAYVRSRHLHYLDTDGQWKVDGTSDFGRISRQQDFLRRMLKAASDKGFFNPSVAQGLLSAAQKYIVFDAGLSINNMLSFAGLLREIPPPSIRTYQVQATGRNIGGNAVLIPQLTGDNMNAIFAIFRGQAPLSAAPTQVHDTSTPTPDPSTAATATTTPTTPAPSVVTTPADNPHDITHGVLPDKNTQC